MNVIDRYTQKDGIDRKLTELLGAFKQRFDRKENSLKLQKRDDQRYTLDETRKREKRIDIWKRSADLIPKHEKRIFNYSSDLQPLVKKRAPTRMADVSTKDGDIIKCLSEQKGEAIKEEFEPVLDCFIRLKREGHFNRSPPRLVVNEARHDRELREYPVHKKGGYGFKRNGFGKQYFY